MQVAPQLSATDLNNYPSLTAFAQMVTKGEHIDSETGRAKWDLDDPEEPHDHKIIMNNRDSEEEAMKNECYSCGQPVCHKSMAGLNLHPHPMVTLNGTDVVSENGSEYTVKLDKCQNKHFCYACLKQECPAVDPETGKKRDVHKFLHGICIYCKVQKCECDIHLRVEVSPGQYEVMIFGGIVHYFQADQDGVMRCVLCNGVLCSQDDIEKRIHKVGDNGSCDHCGRPMCINGHVHECDDQKICKHCNQDLSVIPSAEKCSRGLKHDADPKTGICRKCNKQRCRRKFGHKRSKHNRACLDCHHGLCNDGCKHTLIKKNGCTRMVCTKCNHTRCTGTHFDETCISGEHQLEIIHGQHKAVCRVCGKDSYTQERCTDGADHEFQEDANANCAENRDGLYCVKCGLRKNCDVMNDLCRFEANEAGELICTVCGSQKCPDCDYSPCEPASVTVYAIGTPEPVIHTECANCHTGMCPERGNIKHHEFVTDEATGITYCKHCKRQRCITLGRVHIFSKGTGKCIFCEACFCKRVNINSEFEIAIAHESDMNHECIHCHLPICLEAFNSEPKMLTVCSDDGRGRCRCCKRGICPLDQSHHTFDERGICTKCGGQKCRDYDGHGYCHSNENGFCFYCGEQTCNGKNMKHVFDGNYCIHCHGQRCGDSDCIHSPGPPGAMGNICTGCNKELCIGGKRIHNVQKRVITSVDGKDVDVYVCEHCHAESCEFPISGCGCHMKDLDNRCTKCREYLCPNSQDIIVRHLLEVLNSDDMKCRLCGMGECKAGCKHKHTHTCKYDSPCTCMECGADLCEVTKGKHVFETIRINGQSLTVCIHCKIEQCKQTSDDTTLVVHSFDSNGFCSRCKAYRCNDRSEAGVVHGHRFREVNAKKAIKLRLQVCWFCNKPRCTGPFGSNSTEYNDVCRFSGLAFDDKGIKIRFCHVCLKSRCSGGDNGELDHHLNDIGHEYRGLRRELCQFCQRDIVDDAFTSAVNKFREGDKEAAKSLSRYIQAGFEKTVQNDTDMSPSARKLAELAVDFLRRSTEDGNLTVQMIEPLAQSKNPVALYERGNLRGDINGKVTDFSASWKAGYIPAAIEHILVLLNHKPDGFVDTCQGILDWLLIPERQTLSNPGKWNEFIDKTCEVDLSSDKDTFRVMIIQYFARNDEKRAFELFTKYYDRLEPDTKSKLVLSSFEYGCYSLMLRYGVELVEKESPLDKQTGSKYITQSLALKNRQRTPISAKVNEDDFVVRAQQYVESGGDAECLYMHGTSLLQNEGTTTEGFNCLRRAIEQRHQRSIYAIMKMYREALKLLKDPELDENKAKYIKEVIQINHDMIIEFCETMEGNVPAISRCITNLEEMIQMFKELSNEVSDESLKQFLTSEVAALDEHMKISKYTKEQLELKHTYFSNEEEERRTRHSNIISAKKECRGPVVEAINNCDRETNFPAVRMFRLERSSIAGDVNSALKYHQVCDQMQLEVIDSVITSLSLLRDLDAADLITKLQERKTRILEQQQQQQPQPDEQQPQPDEQQP